MGRLKQLLVTEQDYKNLVKGQSKKSSVTESILNIVVGFIVAMASQIVIFPLFDIHVSHKDHLLIGLLFTAVSFVRSYYLRRFFNYLHVKGIYL